MGREARLSSGTGIYHVMFRGINHEHIFESPADYQKMKKIIQEVKAEMPFKVYAYCLMVNHVHLLLREEHAADLSRIMKKILVRYVMYFNKKYQRSGSLVSNRYKSKPVDMDAYFLQLVSYIHWNPVKAGMVKTAEEYLYSSYAEYIRPEDSNLIDTEMVMDMTDLAGFQAMHTASMQEQMGNEMEIHDSKKRKEKEILEIIRVQSGDIPVMQIAGLPKAQRNQLLRRLRVAGLSIREIERATGIARGVIGRC